MRKILLFFCLFLSFYLVSAQESKWGISLTPALVQSPSIRYGIQAGLEYSINDRLSLLTEFALPIGNSDDPSFSNSRYFRIKPELRYVFSKSRFGPSKYAGFQLSYSYRKWKDLDGGHYSDKSSPDSSVEYDKASIHSPVLTSSLQFGRMYSLGDHFSVDFFAGIGIRMIFTRYSDVENSTIKSYNRRICKIFPAPDPAYWTNTTLTRFHVNAGIRLLFNGL